MPAGPGYRPPKKKGSGGLIAAIVVAVLLLGGIVTLMIFLISRKSGPIIADPSSLPPMQASVAWKHLPSGCDVVMRANVAQMRDVPAVKTHLMPIFDEIQSEAATIFWRASVLRAATRVWAVGRRPRSWRGPCNRSGHACPPSRRVVAVVAAVGRGADQGPRLAVSHIDHLVDFLADGVDASDVGTRLLKHGR